MLLSTVTAVLEMAFEAMRVTASWAKMSLSAMVAAVTAACPSALMALLAKSSSAAAVTSTAEKLLLRMRVAPETSMFS